VGHDEKAKKKRGKWAHIKGGQQGEKVGGLRWGGLVKDITGLKGKMH